MSRVLASGLRERFEPFEELRRGRAVLGRGFEALVDDLREDGGQSAVGPHRRRTGL